MDFAIGPRLLGFARAPNVRLDAHRKLLLRPAHPNCLPRFPPTAVGCLWEAEEKGLKK